AVVEFREALIASGIDDPGLTPYRMALAVGVVAGLIQIGFGLFRLGILGEFFPSSVVHGMLAAIGVIIVAKQAHVVLGVPGVKGEPLELIAHIPHSLVHMNPEIACIGILGLLILFGLPLVKNKLIKRIPAQMLVVLMAIPLGILFDLTHEHTYSLAGHTFDLSPNQFLVNVPTNLANAVALPDFSALQYPFAWKWVIMFALIGSLESLLSAQAVDLLDPWKRKTNLNRDMLAVGFANTIAAAIGGLPMISEIVRSKANIDNGARTRFADLWHGIFLLAFVALVPWLINRIPNAALAAMLVYTGFRLASPREFVHVYHIGREQLAIFVATLIGVLATDLLIGVFIGIGVKFMFHIVNGVPLKSLFMPFLEVEEVGKDTCIIHARDSAVFSNWIPFKRQIEDLGMVQHKNVIVDLSNTVLVDSSVMEKLAQLQDDFQAEGLTLQIEGLETHRQFSHHEHSTRKGALTRIRRLTIVVNSELETPLEEELAQRGVTGFTVIPCRGAGRRDLASGNFSGEEMVRIEVIVPDDICRALVRFIQVELKPEHRITTCVETVEVVRQDDFATAAVEAEEAVLAGHH
ncbi:MAG: SulP family inorganic anion transporter, partial [Planctomycetaceae bacterium]|nr:SulP family inorganic anion transporter [Planctomycetaceae bacterium]